MAGVLKGSLVVGQSGGPTAVINASLCGVVQEAMRHAEIGGIYGMIHGIEGLLDEELADLRSETAQTIEGLCSTPSAALGSCRKKLTESDYERILRILQAHDVRYFIYIGGNDSADTTHRVWRSASDAGYELRAVGVPKTVDNDLAMTDHSPGYGSVARFNAIATRDAGRDTEALHTFDHVKIMETMGRNAGWITASAAFAKEGPDDAPHLIYLPERPFDHERFLDDVKREYDKGRGVVVAVCEGLTDAEGTPIVASKHSVATDSFGHKQLGGVGQYLVDLIQDNLKIKGRTDKPGTIQRMCMLAASPVDVAEARMVGETAVRVACEGVTDHMVTLVRECLMPYACGVGLAQLEAVANAEQPVPDHFINAEGNFVTSAYLDYARPLLGGPLPAHVRLQLRRVEKLVEA